MRRTTKPLLKLFGLITCLGLCHWGSAVEVHKKKLSAVSSGIDLKPRLVKQEEALSRATGNPQQKLQPVLPGIDVLSQQNFQPLHNKRVGLLTHPAGVNRQGKSTLDLLWRHPKVDLVALFGPEHGIYGNERAEVLVEDKIDPRTQLPVYSLYGKYRKPTPKMLKNLDVLVIDLQDLGVRSYTYISCMRLVMEACFKRGIEVMVLDRPNPLGGLKVDGPLLDESYLSYVGAYPVPYVYGLTIGELAKMAKNEPGWLKITDKMRQQGKLTIIPMRGWRRRMIWPDTELCWRATSPNIPTVSAAFGYSMTGLGAEIGGFRHGIGTQDPFRLLTFPHKTAQQIKEAFEAQKIPGVAFRIKVFKNKQGRQQKGVYVQITDYDKLRPTELNFHMMRLACELSKQNPFLRAKQAEKHHATLYNKHVGSAAWWQEITTRGDEANVNKFVKQWQHQAAQFQQHSKQYWLYPS